MFNFSVSIEVIAVTLEITGMALMLSIIVIYGFFLRPQAGYFREKIEVKEILETRFRNIAISGVSLGILGVAFYLLFQSLNLSEVQNISFSQAFGTFSKTVAGSFAIYRGLITLAFFVFLWFRQRKIFDSDKWTINEGFLFLLIIANLFLRSKVNISDLYSHQSFFVGVNLINLVFKSLWAGGLIVFGFAVMPVMAKINLHFFTAKMFLKLSKLIAWIILIGGTTSIYINWLFLQDPASVFSTEWGVRFILLVLSVIILGLLRLYHSFVIDKKIAGGIYPEEIDSIKFTFPLETVFAVLVLIFTSFLVAAALPLERITTDFGFQHLDNLRSIIVGAETLGSLTRLSIIAAIFMTILSLIMFIHSRKLDRNLQDRGAYSLILPEKKHWLGAFILIIFLILVYI